MTTKREIAEDMFECIGLAAYAYDIQPEQMQSALRKLDAMMAQWNARGIRLGFPISNSPKNIDPDQETNLPDAAREAVYINLAKRAAPGFGKQLTPETKALARESFDALMVRAVKPIEMQMPGGVPLGAGVRTYSGRSGFTASPDDVLMAGDDSPLEF